MRFKNPYFLAKSDKTWRGLKTPPSLGFLFSLVDDANLDGGLSKSQVFVYAYCIKYVKYWSLISSMIIAS